MDVVDLVSNTFDRDLKATVSKMLFSEEFADLYLIPDSEDVDDLIPRVIPAHKFIMCSASSYIQEFVTQMKNRAIDPSRSITMVLKGISSQTLNQLLTFVYTGSISIPEADLKTFAEAARVLGVQNLFNEKSEKPKTDANNNQETLKKNHGSLKKDLEHGSLKKDYGSQKKDQESLKKDHGSLKNDHGSLKKDHGSLKKNLETLPVKKEMPSYAQVARDVKSKSVKRSLEDQAKSFERYFKKTKLNQMKRAQEIKVETDDEVEVDAMPTPEVQITEGLPQGQAEDLTESQAEGQAEGQNQEEEEKEPGEMSDPAEGQLVIDEGQNEVTDGQDDAEEEGPEDQDDEVDELQNEVIEGQKTEGLNAVTEGKDDEGQNEVTEVQDDETEGQEEVDEGQNDQHEIQEQNENPQSEGEVLEVHQPEVKEAESQLTGEAEEITSSNGTEADESDQGMATENEAQENNNNEIKPKPKAQLDNIIDTLRHRLKQSKEEIVNEGGRPVKREVKKEPETSLEDFSILNRSLISVKCNLEAFSKSLIITDVDGSKFCQICETRIEHSPSNVFVVNHSLSHLESKNPGLYNEIDQLQRTCLKEDDEDESYKCVLCNVTTSDYYEGHAHFVQTHLVNMPIKTQPRIKKARTRPTKSRASPSTNGYDSSASSKANNANNGYESSGSSMSLEDEVLVTKVEEIRADCDKYTDEMGFDFLGGRCKCNLCPKVDEQTGETQKSRRVTDMKLHVFHHVRTNAPTKYAEYENFAFDSCVKANGENILKCRMCGGQSASRASAISHVFKYHFSTKTPIRFGDFNKGQKLR